MRCKSCDTLLLEDEETLCGSCHLVEEEAESLADIDGTGDDLLIYSDDLDLSSYANNILDVYSND